MMMNTFSTFDLIIKTKLTLMLMFYVYLTSLSHLQLFWSLNSTRLWLILTLSNVVITLVSSSKSNLMVGMTSTMITIFNIILTLNLSSMLPYGPSLTAHLMMDLSLCLPLWVSMIVWSMTYPSMSIAHYLPENTMNFIASFLSLVEGISSIIRPLTLSFRLSANISAGHVIMAMAGTVVSIMLISSIMSFFSVLSMFGAGYYAFELAICSAQSFVLTLLAIIYTNDYFTSIPS